MRSELDGKYCGVGRDIPLIKALYRKVRLPSIVVEILDENVCVADFNPYCSGVIEEKMKCAGYWSHLRILKIVSG